MKAHEEPLATIYRGDCVEVMAELPESSVDAIVCDPPYGLEFMGKEWDRLDAGLPHENVWKGRRGQGGGHVGEDDTRPASRHHVALGANRHRFRRCTLCGKRQFSGSPCQCPEPAWTYETPEGPPSGMVRMQRWHEQWANAAYRVLKPGGHLVAFGGTRTFHRLTCALEDAGFEIRDCLSWLYGSGFPKGRRINSDPGFCQCAVPVHSAESTDRAQPRDGRNGTEHAGGGDGRALSDAPRSTHAARGSRADCLPEDDSDGGQLRLDGGAARASAPSLQCAPGRSRSDVRGDAPASAPSRTPSPARYTDRPSSQDSAGRDSSLSGAESRTQESTSRADTCESADRISDTGQDQSQRKYSIGFPRCGRCGRPNADGWNVALKPAWEPIILARKPLAERNVAANVLAHGTGALNVDGCRIEGDVPQVVQGAEDRIFGNGKGLRSEPMLSNPSPLGRWPANLVLDEAAAARLDEQSGERASAYPGRPDLAAAYAGTEVPLNGVTNFGGAHAGLSRSDSGGASRYFYTAKADAEDRDGSKHPTVKPVDLMKWLVKLVTPPGGVVLDPFLGSGTTVYAARSLGVRSIGIEREADYVADAVRRLRQGVLL